MDYNELKDSMVDPITGKPYKGIVLEGIFADLTQNINNNNRIYSIPEYLQLLAELRQKIHSPKGVYGELEHPSTYAVKFNNVSHKIIDVWYEEDTYKVKGIVLLLNTPNGKICQEIVKSGGCLAVSARASGTEQQQPDGSKLATVKLIVTYDLVYHPGFAESVLNFKELNESLAYTTPPAGYSYILKDEQLKTLPQLFKKYAVLNESATPTECFLGWVGKSIAPNASLDEDTQQTQQQQQRIMQKKKNPQQQETEQEMADAVDQELGEKPTLTQSDLSFHKRLMKLNQQLSLEKVMEKEWQKIEDEPLFDGSAGFLQNGITTSAAETSDIVNASNSITI
jgi:hypothetical protein